MEAGRNATLAADRARHEYHEQLRKLGEPPIVPSSTVVHLVRVPHKKEHKNHTRKNHTNQTHMALPTNQTQVPMNETEVPMNNSEAIVKSPSMSKALASKNITHTTAHANASRLNVTKAVARHKDTMAEK